MLEEYEKIIGDVYDLNKFFIEEFLEEIGGQEVQLLNGGELDVFKYFLMQGLFVVFFMWLLIYVMKLNRECELWL